MARARKQPNLPTTSLPTRSAATDAARLEETADERAEAADGAGVDRERVERERGMDLLVQLAGARIRDEIDAEDARHDRLLAWMAAEARAALSPAERAQVARDGEALLERVRAAREVTRNEDASSSDS